MVPLRAEVGIILAIIASTACSPIHAFAPSCTRRRNEIISVPTSWRSPVAVRMGEGEGDEDSTATVEEAADREHPKDEEDPAVDPEVEALKESIASLESDLKAKRSQLSSLREMAEKYSSTGFARQVALVENNKRMRGANMADSKSAARATVLQSFLPVLEELDAAGARYEGNAFAKTLDAGLRSEFENSLGELGVSEYFAKSGESMDLGRLIAVEEEYSEEFAKGTVIRPLKSGLEISGNVVRPAEVVGSLGSETVGEEVEKGDTEGGDGGDAGETLTDTE